MFVLNQGVLLSRRHLPGVGAEVAGFQKPRSLRTFRAQENLHLTGFWAPFFLVNDLPRLADLRCGVFLGRHTIAASQAAG